MGTSSKNRLSDRDMLLDLLMTEKHMSQVYNSAIMESSSNGTLEIFEQMQHDDHESARKIFDAMHERGWYNSEQSSGTPARRGSRYTNKLSSDYAVTSGTRNFGGRLNYHQ
jgi:Coat F domain.